MVRIATSVSVLLILCSTILVARPQPVGTLLSEGATIDGQPAVAGATVFEGQLISTGEQTAALHLSAGGLLEISPASRVHVNAASGGAPARLEAGSARLKTPSGHLLHLRVPQQRGRIDPQVGSGQVALLSAATSLRDDEIRVNSTDKILTTAPILIRAADGTKEAVYYIRSVSGDRVRLTSPVGREFVPGDLVLQGNPLDEALAGGAIIVGGPAASGGGGISTGALVGIIVGVGAGAGLAAAAAGGGGGNGSPPPPGSQIAP